MGDKIFVRSQANSKFYTYSGRWAPMYQSEHSCRTVFSIVQGAYKLSEDFVKPYFHKY